MITLGLMLGWTSDFLAVRVGNPYSVEVATKLIVDLESQGATFEDRDEAFVQAFEVIYREVRRHSDGRGFYLFAIFGLAPVVFGLFPSRKPKQIQ